jgi:O-antigen/teichoic acid export membrane protein
VVLSRRGLDAQEARARIAWLLWTPFLIATFVAAASIVASPVIASVVLGDSALAGIVVLAMLGLPPAVAAQIAIGAAQAMGERIFLLLAALVSAASGSAVVLLFMAQGSIRLAAASLAVAPLVQAVAVIAVCPTLRGRVLAKPRLPRNERRVLLSVSGASFALGVFAILGDNLARSAVVLTHGVAAVGTYQPAALLSGQFFSIALSALAATMMVESSQFESETALASSLGSATRDMVLVATFLALMMSACRSLVIPAFFDKSLLPSGQILAVSLVGEPLRCAAWMCGSVLLPLGYRRMWLAIGLMTVGTQTLVGLGLSAPLGVWALPISTCVAAGLSAVVTVHALRRRGIRVTWILLLAASGGSACLLASALTAAPAAWHVSYLTLIAAAALALLCLAIGRRLEGPLRAVTVPQLRK